MQHDFSLSIVDGHVAQQGISIEFEIWTVIALQLRESIQGKMSMAYKGVMAHSLLYTYINMVKGSQQDMFSK